MVYCESQVKSQYPKILFIFFGTVYLISMSFILDTGSKFSELLDLLFQLKCNGDSRILSAQLSILLSTGSVAETPWGPIFPIATVGCHKPLVTDH